MTHNKVIIMNYKFFKLNIQEIIYKMETIMISKN